MGLMEKAAERKGKKIRSPLSEFGSHVGAEVFPLSDKTGLEGVRSSGCTMRDDAVKKAAEEARA